MFPQTISISTAIHGLWETITILVYRNFSTRKVQFSYENILAEIEDIACQHLKHICCFTDGPKLTHKAPDAFLIDIQANA